MNPITIIKPEEGEGVYPIPEIRRIYPSRRLLFKYYLTSFVIWCIIALSILSLAMFISFVNEIDGPSSEPPLPSFIINAFVLLFLIGSFVAFSLIIVLCPIYVNSMEYIVHGNEVVVKKGLLNKTIKYCPFRTVTNISTRAGPFDRLFGIGCVNIETAGKSSTSSTPEEVLEGLLLFHEIRDYILKQLRSYDPSKLREGLTVAYDLQALQQETINELKEIKKLLNKKTR
ncbi:MAG: PH domain-containing protein [Candidatus Hodarchaeota archaeon]